MRLRAYYLFQSSPGPQTGCNSRGPREFVRWLDCFNPHPARRPGATSRPAYGT